MIKKILPILLALIGLGAGVGAGIALRPAPEIISLDPCGDVPHVEEAHDDEMMAEDEVDTSAFEYVKLNNQFVIPDIEGDLVAAMVVVSLNLEVKIGTREVIYAREPKLRDGFLQVLFDHANAGGFKGTFTDSASMTSLRGALIEVAQNIVGTEINDVLIIDIVRQDM